MSRRDRDLRSSRDDEYSDDDRYSRRREEDTGSPLGGGKLARYRGAGGRDGGGGRELASPQPVGLSVNLNVEQMVSMVYEMRGTLSHEVEARRATEHALSDARAQIEALKDVSQRDNNKWSNLLGRVKELEVAGKLDTRLTDMNSRAEKYARNNDQGKLLHVFQEIKSRLDGQERDYRDGLAKIAREQQRDAQRMEQDLRASMEQQFIRVEGMREKELDQTARMQARINDLEKEFSMFMSAQAQLQMSINSKEKDGDWLKIYLTEQFNAQKHATETKFAEMEHQLERLQESSRMEASKTLDLVDRKMQEVGSEIESERGQRNDGTRKVQKALRLAVTNMSDSISKAVTLLDSKLHQLKTTQNEAISNLHAMVQENHGTFERHLSAFADFIGVQTDQTAKGYNLGQRLDALEEVLKAEIKSRLKNHQKQKLMTQDLERKMGEQMIAAQSSLNDQFDEVKTFLQREAELKAKQDAEDEAHANLLHIAMETRSTLDAMVGQVEEQHYVDLRKHEWKAFGQVIEAELKAREEEVDRKIEEVKQGRGAGMIKAMEEQVDQVKDYVSRAFTDFASHEKLLKAEEEEQAHMLHCAMESRAVLESMCTHIADEQEAQVWRVIQSNVRVLDERTHAHSDQLASFRTLLTSERENTSNQLQETHGEVLKLAQELAHQVDGHTGQLDGLTIAMNSMRRDIGEVEDVVNKSSGDLIALKGTVGDAQDQLQAHKKDADRTKAKVDDVSEQVEKLERDAKATKIALEEVNEQVGGHTQQLRSLGANVKDSMADAEKQRVDLESKLSQKVQDTASALSHSTAKVDELAAIVKRLDLHDKATHELVISTDNLSGKQTRLEQSLHSLQTLIDDTLTAKQVRLEQNVQALQVQVDDHALVNERKLKELRDKLETDLDDSSSQLKKLEKKLGAAQEDLDALQSEMALKSGAGAGQVKNAEEGLQELRGRVKELAAMQEKLDALRGEMKSDLSKAEARIADQVTPQLEKNTRELEKQTRDLEKQSRDLKDLQSNLRELEEEKNKDIKSVKESVSQLDERQVKSVKDAASRIQSVEQSLMKVQSSSSSHSSHSPGGGHDDSSSGAAHHQAKRIVDASIVEKEVQSVEASVEALSRKFKENANAQEDALNRIQQDVKKNTMRIDSLEESTHALKSPVVVAAPSNNHNNASEASSIESRKAVTDLSFRVDALENSAKQLSSVSGVAHELKELQSKVELRTKEVDTRLHAQETRADKLDSELKRLGEVSDQADEKQNRMLKELRASIDDQSQRDAEVQNGLKSDLKKSVHDLEQSLTASEQRSSSSLKSLQKQVDDHHTETKAQFRTMDEKLHDMTWSLEYAKDAAFKADATQVRAGATAKQANHPDEENYQD